MGGMFQRIVVGVDEREGGRDALALGARLVAPEGSLILCRVHVGDPVGESTRATAEQERARQQLAAAAESADVAAEVRVIDSTRPGRGLHELAEAEDADLIVVGSTRRSLLGRVLVGDDTNAALNGAVCAVAVAPAGYAAAASEILEIGVGYDGTPESVHALSVARELAAEFGATLSAFQAIELPRDPFTGGTAQVDAQAIPALIEQARERIAALGDVQPHAAYGFPSEELGLYSASVDLLVVGSRGYGPIRRLMHGSTSQHLAHTARSPLLVLPRADA
jgi:nucleotide-binding universal stress UspA family protein